MQLGNYVIYDIETDGLLDKLSKIHCMCLFFHENYKLVRTMTFRADGKADGTIEQGLKLLEEANAVAGHNIMMYDQIAKKKLYPNYKETRDIWDTLALSWYLYPKQYKDGIIQNRKEFGLEAWGREFGFPKVQIDDWENLSLDEYCDRCFRDCEINSILMKGALEYLLEIYGSEEKVYRFMKYIQFKMECAREQYEMGLYVDRKKAEQYLTEIAGLIIEKYDILKKSMPQVPIKKKVTRPKTMYKKDNTLSVAGQKFKKACESVGLNYIQAQEVEFIDGYKEPNPGSDIQLKKWLYSLGWEPLTFVERKNTKGEFKSVEQIRTEEKELCPSIKALIPEHPELEELEGLSILEHRQGVFKSFLENSNEDGWTYAGIQGLTNTLRFKHQKPIANLPKVTKPWGKEIRSLICVPEGSGYTLCGSDMSSLEDTTKQHYMYYFDPEYVTQMRTPGFDPHIDIAVFAQLIAKEDEEFFKWYKAQPDGYEFTDEQKTRYKFISDIRGDKAKPVNFGGVYGAGPPKMAKMLKSTLEFATMIHTAYWQRNKAVKQVEGAVVYKELHNQLWLFNPVSQFWYPLRALKDRFSTLNQGTGVYCFDLQIQKVRSQNIKIMLQYHDEIGFPVKLGLEEQTKAKLNSAIEQVNAELKLNVPLGISMDFGSDYSLIH